MRAFLRRAYLPLAAVLGFEDSLLRRIRAAGSVVVLNLHSVSPERNDFYPPLHPDAFDRLLAFLCERLTVTTFAGLAGLPPGEPAAILSFDDGFYDFVEHAMPVLRRHGLRANQNVIASSVLSGVPPWTQRFNDLLAGAPQRLLAELRVPGFDRPAPADDPEARVRYGAALGGFLTARSRAERAPLVAELEHLLARADIRGTRMMSVADVKKAAAVHEIGAHSVAHDFMARESVDFFSADLNECERLFRDTLGLPLSVYAFPNGGHLPEQVEVLRRRGLSAILLVGDRYASRHGPVFARFNVGAREPRLMRLEALGVRARRQPW